VRAHVFVWLAEIGTSAANGSNQALGALVARLPDIPMSQRGPLLTVFYAYLDPTDIPTAAALDARLVAGSSQTTIRRAFLSLGALPDLVFHHHNRPYPFPAALL